MPTRVVFTVADHARTLDGRSIAIVVTAVRSMRPLPGFFRRAFVSTCDDTVFERKTNCRQSDETLRPARPDANA
jgi:hypothetical protein